jgi:hypothetical protein
MRYESLSIGELITSGVPKNEYGNGAASHSSIVACECGDAVLHRTVLTLTNTPITITDDAGVAQYGGVKVYDFPPGVINVLSAVVKGNLTLGVTGTIIDTYTGVVALGSATAGTGATLVTTEATFLQSTAIGTAAAKVSAVIAFPIATQLTESGSRHIDGRVTPADMYLNFAIADDATHTSGTGKFTGTIEFTWINAGGV